MSKTPSCKTKSQTIFFLVDLDNTIYHADTTIELFKMLNYRRFKILYSFLGFINPVLKILNKLLHIDSKKFILFNLIVKNKKIGTFEAILYRTVSELDKNKNNREIIDMIKRINNIKIFCKKTKKCTIKTFLFTASLKPISLHIGNKLFFDFCLGSSVYVDKKGNIKRYYDIYDRKKKYVDLFFSEYFKSLADTYNKIDRIIVIDDQPEKGLEKILEKYADDIKIFTWGKDGRKKIK